MAEKNIKEMIQRSYERYQSYDSQVWASEFFDENTGGYVVTDLRRIAHSGKSKNEKGKYEEELDMAEVFAMDGHQMEMLDEDSRELKNDININGIPADMKRIHGTNNILRAAKKATRKQGSKMVLFQFDKDDERVRLELLKLKREGYNVLYFFSDERKVHEL